MLNDVERLISFAVSISEMDRIWIVPLALTNELEKKTELKFEMRSRFRSITVLILLQLQMREEIR